ncbi:hypothetical protein F2P79_006874 [Pimephales promelas]|nr:hypothetical protein F2P79_006874 [Pimephales promelas]KAG1958967.1 hypothetical protein F2P79_006874 [Pimephales promelas]
MDSVEDEFMDSLRKKVSGLKEVYSSLSVPIIMVILHSTFDPERIIPDSNNAIQRENTLAVDCLIFDNKLLRCQKNDNAIVQTAHLFKSKKVTSYYCLNYHGDRKLFIDQKATKVSRCYEAGDERRSMCSFI